MAQTNTAFALLTLGQWCRNHGIYEIRDVLGRAALLAVGAESSDLLAAVLEEAAMAADVQVQQPPNPPPPQPHEAADESPVAHHLSAKKRRARSDAGHFKADSPATPDVNEAWEGGDAAQQ